MIKFIRRFTMLQRFSMLALLAAVLFSVPFYLYLREAQGIIKTAVLERNGLQVTTRLLETINLLQKHRGHVGGALTNTGGTLEQRAGLAAETGKAIDELLKLSSTGLVPAPYRPVFEKAAADWKSLNEALTAKSLQVQESRARHNAIIQALNAQRDGAIDDFGLSLDPEASTFHLIMGGVVYLPGLNEALSTLRARGTDTLVQGSNDADDRTAAMVYVEKVGNFDRGVDQGFAKAIAADPSLAEPLEALKKDAAQQLKNVMELSRGVLMGRETGATPDTYRARMNAAIAAHDKLGTAGIAQLERLLKARENNLKTTLYGVIAFAMAIFALTLLLGFLIARSIVRPVRDAAGIADAVAQGDLDKQVPGEHGDEVGRLVAAMKRMQVQLKTFAAAQVTMAERHEAGEISYRMDAATLPGAFGVLAQRNNDLVASHIAVKMRVVEVLSGYAKGDLSADMDRLPGEKARITEVMDAAKANLQAISAQIQTLVDAAGKGDFTVRGDEARFDHEFRKMVAGLNQLVRTSDRGLREVSRVLGALAKGDLTEKMSGDYQGTFAQLKQDCNQTVENLTAIVHQIKEASETIDTASREITQGNTDLSQRTEEQASSLEQTASSMEELSSTVTQNADNARQANQLAVGASDVAGKGGDVVKQVVTTMSGISGSSKKIADIISVIDGIAFQTNILALNAAVEAARAGEQGRGFAVVATEVRNLAQRSANAAREIKELITDSVSRVDAGTQLVDEAGKTMDEIVTSVKRVTDIMAEITAASQEQASGIEQVKKAITQMDEVTQQNAALVEEAAAAAESMQEQSGALVQSVGTFKLAQDAGMAVIERRGPDRAANVARLPKQAMASRPVAPKRELNSAAQKPVAKKVVGSDEEWQEF